MCTHFDFAAWSTCVLPIFDVWLHCICGEVICCRHHLLFRHQGQEDFPLASNTPTWNVLQASLVVLTAGPGRVMSAQQIFNAASAPGPGRDLFAQQCSKAASAAGTICCSNTRVLGSKQSCLGSGLRDLSRRRQRK